MYNFLVWILYEVEYSFSLDDANTSSTEIVRHQRGVMRFGTQAWKAESESWNYKTGNKFGRVVGSNCVHAVLLMLLLKCSFQCRHFWVLYFRVIALYFPIFKYMHVKVEFNLHKIKALALIVCVLRIFIVQLTFFCVYFIRDSACSFCRRVGHHLFSRWCQKGDQASVSSTCTLITIFCVHKSVGAWINNQALVETRRDTVKKIAFVA